MSALPRGIRTACDFCHNKRIKCRREDGSTKCIQCTARNQACKFSPKEKTGPKPKQRNKDDNSSSLSPPLNKSAKSTPWGDLNHRLKDKVRSLSSSPTGGRRGSNSGVPNSQDKLENLHPTTSTQFVPGGRGDSMTLPQQSQERTGEVQELEDTYLKAYLGTIAQLLPFCEDSMLLQASALRQGRVSLSGVESPMSQAYLSAALAIGALMFNDPRSEYYHLESRTQLKQLFSSMHPAAAGVLCMLGFYWLCKGENAKKDTYLQHARIGLSNSTVPPNLQLIIDHLDYDNRTSLRPDTRSMNTKHRTLHAVSCLLCDMSRLMNPMLGSVFAQAYCQELRDCGVGLEEEVTKSCQLELPRLLCYSLRGFLLVLLGERNEAISILAKIPALLESNPYIAKALPLSWDTAVIAGSLAFILGMKTEYQVIFNVVDAQRNTCIAASWMCRLPEPESSLEVFLSHQCRSSSNICSIICHIGITTQRGTVAYYDPGVHPNVIQDPFASTALPPDTEAPSDYRRTPPGTIDPKESNGGFILNRNGQTLPVRGMNGSADMTGDSSRIGMPVSIGDMKDPYGIDDSLSEHLLGFVMQQASGGDDGKGNLQALDADDRSRASLRNMSFGSFHSGRRGSRQITGLSDTLAGMLDESDFMNALDEWEKVNPSTGPEFNSGGSEAIHEQNNPDMIVNGGAQPKKHVGI